MVLNDKKLDKQFKVSKNNNFNCLHMKKNKKIVLCHGVFDLVHPGHLNYLKKAKQLGDILIVSVTSDKYVNKGPGRPVFDIHQRISFLADLKFVDKVYESKDYTAEKVIEKIKPDIYCKGIDYSNKKKNKKDANLIKEINSLKKHGGKFVFVKEKKFSSSRLINNNDLQNLNKEQIDYIKSLKKIISLNDINKNIEKFKKLKVLVVGEIIIDNYIFIEPVGKSGKEPILIYKKKNENKFIGGTGYISNLVSSFSKSVDLFTYIGERKEEFNFIKNNLNKKIKLHYVTKNKSPTIIKTRYLESYRYNKIMGIYKVNDALMTGLEEKYIIKKLSKLVKKCDLIILADYGHGFIKKNIRNYLQKFKNKLYLNAQINSFNRDFHSLSKYKFANSLVLNESELRHEMKDQDSNLDKLVKKLKTQIKLEHIIVTKGRFGATHYVKNNKFHCPAFSNIAIDSTGAGDTYFSLASLGLSARINYKLMNLISSIASSYSVNNLTNKKYYNKKLLLRHLNYMLS